MYATTEPREPLATSFITFIGPSAVRFKRRVEGVILPNNKHPSRVRVYLNKGFKRFKRFTQIYPMEEILMANEPLSNKPGQGILFLRQATGNQPNMKGGVNIDGVEYELAAWNKTAKKTGRAYISLKIQRPYRQPESAPASAPAPAEIGEDDESAF